MAGEAGQPGAVFESGEGEFVSDDCGEPSERDGERVMVEYGNAEQGQAEQDEIDGNSKEDDRFDQGNLGIWC
jgi:hypothetical protein